MILTVLVRGEDIPGKDYYTNKIRRYIKTETKLINKNDPSILAEYMG